MSTKFKGCHEVALKWYGGMDGDDLVIIAQMLEHKFRDANPTVEVRDNQFIVSFYKDKTSDVWEDRFSDFFNALKSLTCIHSWHVIE